MRRRIVHKLYEKYKSIGWGIFLIVLTIGSVLFCLIKKSTIKVYSVDYIKVSEVKVRSLMELSKNYYGDASEFTVRSQENIEWMAAALDEEHLDKREDAIGEATSFSVNFLFKNGTNEEFTLTYAGVPADSYMGKVFCSEEVVKQIRAVFTMNRDKVARVELFHWKNETDASAITEEIKQKKMIDEIIEVAKEDTLKRPAMSMESTRCGICFRDKASRVLLIVNLSKDMEGYDRLVKKIPNIGKYV